MQKNKKLALNSGLPTLTNGDEVCIPCLSRILLAVKTGLQDGLKIQGGSSNVVVIICLPKSGGGNRPLCLPLPTALNEDINLKYLVLLSQRTIRLNAIIFIHLHSTLKKGSLYTTKPSLKIKTASAIFWIYFGGTA